jgi:hypothetical protein
MKLLALWVLAAVAPLGPAWATEAPAPRVEARSADLLAVGVVHGDAMSIHVSRSSDNAPVRDAVISVVLRGTAHAATAEADGSYSLQTKDLSLPGAAAIEFQVNIGTTRENLEGTLDIAAAAGALDDRNSARQLWWWVLNFAVCFGILWLISHRRKTKAKEPV